MSKRKKPQGNPRNRASGRTTVAPPKRKTSVKTNVIAHPGMTRSMLAALDEALDARLDTLAQAS